MNILSTTEAIEHVSGVFPSPRVSVASLSGTTPAAHVFLG
jgi:hypothetical protein